MIGLAFSYRCSGGIYHTLLDIKIEHEDHSRDIWATCPSALENLQIPALTFGGEGGGAKILQGFPVPLEKPG